MGGDLGIWSWGGEGMTVVGSYPGWWFVSEGGFCVYKMVWMNWGSCRGSAYLFALTAAFWRAWLDP